jgi:hypothetical protein
MGQPREAVLRKLNKRRNSAMRPCSGFISGGSEATKEN